MKTKLAIIRSHLFPMIRRRFYSSILFHSWPNRDILTYHYRLVCQYHLANHFANQYKLQHKNLVLYKGYSTNSKQELGYTCKFESEYRAPVNIVRGKWQWYKVELTNQILFNEKITAALHLF